MKEKNKIIMHRIIWLCITLLFIFIPIISSAVQPDLKIVDESVTSEYNSSYNWTDVDITLTFNREVNSGYVDIAFYDNNGELLTEKNIYMYSSGKTAKSFLETVYDGEVTSYEIISTDFSTSNNISTICWAFVPFAVIMFISTLLLSYKEYVIDDKIISVYAGFYHHTLRINGEKYDEHNTIMTFTPIRLSTTLENGSKIEVIISLTNRISTKLNDKILMSK